MSDFFTEQNKVIPSSLGIDRGSINLTLHLMRVFKQNYLWISVQWIWNNKLSQNMDLILVDPDPWMTKLSINLLYLSTLRLSTSQVSFSFILSHLAMGPNGWCLGSSRTEIIHWKLWTNSPTLDKLQYFTNLDLAEMDSLTKLHFGVRSCGVAILILPNNMVYLL